MKRFAATMVAAVLVGGCSAPIPAETPTPSEQAASGPRQAVTYGSLVSLRDAAIAAGYECPEWKQDNRAKLAAESGQCSDSDRFSTYVTESEVAEAVAGLKSFGIELSLLVGPNWLINTKDEYLDLLQVGLGGTIVRADEEED
jgi:hypothetical protein